METVWKFAFVNGPQLILELPEGSEPLAAQFPIFGDNHIQLWVRLDRSLMHRKEKLRTYEFYTYMTGDPITRLVESKFLATCEDPKTGLIWHVFWRGEK